MAQSLHLNIEEKLNNIEGNQSLMKVQQNQVLTLLKRLAGKRSADRKGGEEEEEEDKEEEEEEEEEDVDAMEEVSFSELSTFESLLKSYVSFLYMLCFAGDQVALPTWPNQTAKRTTTIGW